MQGIRLAALLCAAFALPACGPSPAETCDSFCRCFVGETRFVDANECRGACPGVVEHNCPSESGAGLECISDGACDQSGCSSDESALIQCLRNNLSK